MDTLTPTWVLLSATTTVTVSGTNFYGSNVKDVRLESSDGLRTYVDADWTYVDAGTLTFDFPDNQFLNKDFVKVKVTFDGARYYTVDERIVVYSEIEIVDAKPQYIYTSSGSTTYDLFVFGENFWDTEGVGLLTCMFDGDPLTETVATYVNQTLAVCPAPASSSTRTSTVQLSIDGANYAATTASFSYIDPPTFSALSVTNIILLLSEEVDVTITGTNLNTNTNENLLYVKVGQTVVTAQPTSATATTFKTPAGIEAGTYEVTISTDGVNFLSGDTTQSITFAACAAGQYCTSFAPYDCPVGYQCPDDVAFEAIPCPPGYY